MPKRYFKVPEPKADEFCNSYKKFHSNESVLSPMRVLVPVLLVTGFVNFFTRNLAKSAQWAAALGSGFLTAMGTTRFNTNFLMKKEDKILQSLGAEEIIQKPKQIEFLNKSK